MSRPPPSSTATVLPLPTDSHANVMPAAPAPIMQISASIPKCCGRLLASTIIDRPSDKSEGAPHPARGLLATYFALLRIQSPGCGNCTGIDCALRELRRLPLRECDGGSLIPGGNAQYSGAMPDSRTHATCANAGTLRH